ncbi:MAG: amidophosphoribosyltransferase [Sphingomonadales bacterium]|jgi:amidophosphoribosyltransferase
MDITTHPFDDDKLREECGIFGIFGTQDAATHTVLGLHALQHRGQEAAGITSFDGTRFHSHKSAGHVGDNFSSPAIMEQLKGRVAIGHVRYSTTGETAMRNVQPLFAELSSGGFAVAHNGNLTNAATLRRDLIARGSIFQSTSDTEVIIHLLANSRNHDILDQLIDSLKQIEGAYSLIALAGDMLIGVRDPLGVRPLVLGRLEDGSSILASETCALDIIGAVFLREIEPGEVVIISDEGLRSFRPFPPTPARPCIFEHVYFSRPDSYLDGFSVYNVRKRIGAELAQEAPVDADMIVPVPDSGTPAAIGYAQQVGIPFELGIVRNHYIGRTFIEPTDNIRHLGVKLKLNANNWQLKGKRVVLVDDSIVRGTTSVKIVEMVRRAGASEVHMRIASPPTRFPCYYGVDTPERSKLLASNMDLDSMCKYIGCDSLAFISLDGLYRALELKSRNVGQPQFCDACFSGEYPTRLTDRKELEAPKQKSLLTES